MESILGLSNLLTIKTSHILGALMRLYRATIVYYVYLVLYNNFSLFVSLEAI